MVQTNEVITRMKRSARTKKAIITELQPTITTYADLLKWANGISARSAVTTVLVDREFAQLIIKNHRTSANRPINEDNVKFLSGLMREGKYGDLQNLVLAEDLSKGTVHLLNSQHTCHAIAHTGIPQRFTVTWWVAQNRVEVGKMFGWYDNGAKRSFSHIFRATVQPSELEQIEAELGGLGIVKNIATAVRIMANGLSKQRGKERICDDKLYGPVRFQIQYAIQFERLIQRLDTSLQKSLRGGVHYAFGLFLVRYNPSLARDFYSGLANAAAWQDGDPRKEYVNLLQENTLQGLEARTWCRIVADLVNCFTECRRIYFGKAEMDRYKERAKKGERTKLAGTPLDGTREMTYDFATNEVVPLFS